MKNVLLFMAAFFLLVACKEDPKPDPNPKDNNDGRIEVNFLHQINGVDIEFDTTMYVNAAGNEYQVNEIQYFITDVVLHKAGGTQVKIDDWKWYHYIDTDIPETLKWTVFDNIPVGNYDSISFTFGFNAQRNQSFMFVNPPEVNMFWPEFLGGGYHYMKLNMKWKNAAGNLQGNDFHLGRGQIRDGQGNITGFVENFFEVTLPASSFTITKGNTRKIDMIMNVDQWFENPNVYDFDVWTGSIMENQDAMQTAVENGHNVFTVGTIN